nr:MAG TPA: hypothetical protein [Caudoviricetes sp.]
MYPICKPSRGTEQNFFKPSHIRKKTEDNLFNECSQLVLRCT